MTDSDALPEVPRRVVRCPRCGGPSVYAPSNKNRPFCSPRCHAFDLGAWSTESYRVPAAASDPDVSEADPPSRDDDV